MTVPFWCLLVAVVIPYVLAVFGATQRQAQLGQADNKNYRVTQVPKLVGAGSRAYAAQANAWEALAVFTAAVTVAHLSGADQRLSAIAALVFVGARVLHAVFYLADLDKLRSTSVAVGTGCCVWLFVLAAQA